MKSHFLWFTWFFLLISLTGFSQFRTETQTFLFEEYQRSYHFYVPNNYSQNKIYPLVFVLHGGGGKAKGMLKLTRARFNQLANRDGFIVVYPNGIGKSWNDGARDTFGVARNLNIDDVGFIKKIISDLDRKVNVDHTNIFACGISNGGFMAQRLAYELSDKIKGIGVVAANLSRVQSQTEIPENPVPVIFINGTKDPLVPFPGGQVTVLKSKRGEVLSVQESVEIWKKVNGCSQNTGEYLFPDKNKNDKCTATKMVWQNPANSKIKVVAITVKNGGHTWPGTKQYLPRRLVGNTNYDFNGCDEIWNFFKSLI